MEQEQMRAACALLVRHWSEGTQLDALPPELRPADRAEAYRVQAWIEGFSRLPLYGWKIAATSLAGQRHIGVDGPLAGRLLAERVIEDGGACPLAGNLMKVAELEFAFRMGDDLAPRADPYTQEEVLAHVASLHPAIELLIRASRISSTPAWRSWSPTMPAPTALCWDRRPMPIGEHWTWPRIRDGCCAMACWRK